MVWLIPVLGLLSKLPGLVGEYFTQLNNLQKIKLETDRDIALAKQKMASDIAAAQLELNKTIVSSTGSYFKYFTFIMWFGPFMIGVVFPNASKEIFHNLMLMPEWYVQSCMLIMFTVWGISVSAPVVSGIFSGLSSFLSNRRDFQLEKAKIDRKVFFEILRKIKGPLTELDVQLSDQLLDKAEQSKDGH